MASLGRRGGGRSRYVRHIERYCVEQPAAKAAHQRRIPSIRARHESIDCHRVRLKRLQSPPHFDQSAGGNVIGRHQRVGQRDTPAMPRGVHRQVTFPQAWAGEIGIVVHSVRCQPITPSVEVLFMQQLMPQYILRLVNRRGVRQIRPARHRDDRHARNIDAGQIRGQRGRIDVGRHQPYVDIGFIRREIRASVGRNSMSMPRFAFSKSPRRRDNQCKAKAGMHRMCNRWLLPRLMRSRVA